MLPVLYVGCLAFRPQPLAAPFIKPTEYPLSHWDCDGPSIVCLDGSVACNHSAYPLCNKTKSTASCSYFGVSSTVPYEYFCGPTNDTLYNLKEVLPVTEYECIDDGGIWQVCDDLGFVNQTYCMGMSSSLCSGYDACETYGFDACLFSTAGPTTISPSQPPSSPTANPTRAPTFQLAPKDYPFAIMTEESADPTNLFPVSRDLCLGDYAVCDDGRVFCTDSSTFGDCIRPSSSLSGVTCHSSASNGQVPTSNLCGSEDGGVVTPYNISDYFAVTPFHCYNQTNDFGSLCIVNKEGSVTFGLSTVTGIFSFVENFYCSGASQCSYTYLCESNPTLFSGACDPRTGAPTNSPSVSPTLSPTAPTAVPTESPSSQPTARPTSYPTEYIPFEKPNFPLVASQCNGLYAICEGGEVFCKNLTQYPDCEAPENADPLISTSCHYTSPSGGPITDSMRLDVLDYPCVNGNSRLNVYTFLGISDYDCFNVTGNEIQMCFNNDDIVNYYCGKRTIKMHMKKYQDLRVLGLLQVRIHTAQAHRSVMDR